LHLENWIAKAKKHPLAELISAQQQCEAYKQAMEEGSDSFGSKLELSK
jgi:hypothetical protein